MAEMISEKEAINLKSQLEVANSLVRQASSMERLHTSTSTSITVMAFTHCVPMLPIAVQLQLQ